MTELLVALHRRTAQRGLAALGVLGAGGLLMAMLITGGPVGLLGAASVSLSSDTREVPAPPQSTRIVDRNGRLIGVLFAEENRIVIPREQMPNHLRSAVIAIEDDRFYDHEGVNVTAAFRALLANLREGGITQGGSTITQQYVRNVFDEVGTKRTLARKVREALAAVEFEREHSKEEILDAYLNTVYFGRGAYGVQAAARTYFGKSAEDLDLPESAFLAGVIQAPERYSTDPKAARVRRDVVLGRMHSLGMISAKEAGVARASPLRFRSERGVKAKAAYFVEHVRRLLLAPRKRGGFGLSESEVFTKGLTVHTTLDWTMQREAERAVTRVLDRRGDPEAALVAMTTRGEIRAMVGGRDFDSVARARGFNFATQRGTGGGRQAGSSFKPFTLAQYVTEGNSVRRRFRAPARISVPECPNEDGTPWRPGNYDDLSRGYIDVVEATAGSVNTVYAQLAAKVGAADIAKMARRVGITSPLDPVCSLALGTFGVTPLEMARAYATFGARGVRPEVIAVTKIEGADGSLIAEQKPRGKRTLKRRVADVVNQVLAGVMTDGTGAPARISREAAGKTGTTQRRRDVWFVGHTPHPGLSTAVWVGNPADESGRIKPMTTFRGRPATGGRIAGRIWKLFMEKAVRSLPEREFAEVRFGPVEYERGRLGRQRRFREDRQVSHRHVHRHYEAKPSRSAAEPEDDERDRLDKRKTSPKPRPPQDTKPTTEPTAEPTSDPDASDDGGRSDDEPPEEAETESREDSGTAGG